MASFDAAVEYLLKWEKGYVNHPEDPGKETNFGISKKSYPALDIRALTRDDAIAIYRRDYWDALKLDALSPGRALILFECAVIQGRALARKLMKAPLREIAAQRAYHYALLDAIDDTFALGWMRRLFETYDRAKELEAANAPHQGFTF